MSKTWSSLHQRARDETTRFKSNHPIYWKRADIDSLVAVISANIPDYFFEVRDEAFRIIKEEVCLLKQ